MKLTHLLGAVTLSAGMMASANAATTAPAAKPSTSISKTAAFVTDYVYRGESWTDNKPAIQGGIEYKVGNAYMGAWASNVEDGNAQEGVPVMVEAYFGYNHQFGKFNLDTSVKTYNFLFEAGDFTEFRFATNPTKELELAVNREVKYGAWYFEGSFEKYLPHRLYLDLSGGLWSVDDGDQALTFRAELARDFPEFHHVDVFAAINYLSDETFRVEDNTESSDMTVLLGVRKNF